MAGHFAGERQVCLRVLGVRRRHRRSAIKACPGVLRGGWNDLPVLFVRNWMPDSSMMNLHVSSFQLPPVDPFSIRDFKPQPQPEVEAEA